MTLDSGSIVGEYLIDSFRRQGAGGTIYRAEQPSLGRSVALHVCEEPANSVAVAWTAGDAELVVRLPRREE